MPLEWPQSATLAVQMTRVNGPGELPLLKHPSVPGWQLCMLPSTSSQSPAFQTAEAGTTELALDSATVQTY